MSENEDECKKLNPDYTSLCPLNKQDLICRDEKQESTNAFTTPADEKINLIASPHTDYSTINKSSDNSIQITNKTTAFDLWKGLFYMFLSCVFKSTFSVLSKWALKDKKDLSSFQLLTYRTYFMLWICIAVLSVLPINVFSQQFIRRDKLIYVIIRTIFAIISMSLVVFAIKFMHISDVYSVYYIYPAFIILLSFFFLKKEKLGILDYLCLVACFVGALLIVKPEFIFHDHESSSRTFMFCLVLFAAFLKAIEDVLVRNVGSDAHCMIFPLMYSIFGMIIFPVPMIINDKVYPKFSLTEVFLVFIIAVCTFLYQIFMALGLQNETASRVSLVNYMQVALMFVSDLLIFDKQLNFMDLLGTLLIFGCNFINGFYKVHKRWNDLKSFKSSERNRK